MGRIVALYDLNVLGRLCAGWALTGVIPRRLDAWLVPRLVRGTAALASRDRAAIEARMRLVLGPFLPDTDFEQLARCFQEMVRETGWLRLRALHDQRVPVRTDVEGVDRLRLALERGHGAILWGMSFCDTLVVKIGLSRADVHLVHLSNAGHGGAHPPTIVGRRLLSPLYCIGENRYLAERVVIPADGSPAYLRVLIDRLAENRCIYLAGERWADLSNTAVPLLGREARLARGAPGLAWKMGSALLPVDVIRSGPLRYRIVIGEPVDVDRGSTRNRFIEDALIEFAKRVERSVLDHPADWDWYRHTVDEWVRTARH